MKKVIKYLRKAIKKNSDAIAYLIIVGIPILILVLWLAQYLDYTELF